MAKKPGHREGGKGGKGGKEGEGGREGGRGRGGGGGEGEEERERGEGGGGEGGRGDAVEDKSTEETVKTIARGMPGCSGEPVVTMLVYFVSFAREAAGASCARLFLRPLLLRERTFRQASRKTCGEIAEDAR